MNVASSKTHLLEDDGNSNYHKPGEVVEIVCNEDFFFFDKNADYTYECLEDGC